MSKESVYRRLEERILKYAEYADMPVMPCGERMVPLRDTSLLRGNSMDPDMRAYTGDKIFVRETVAQMLEKAAKKLQEVYPELQLEIVYGYRALEIQKKIFERVKSELAQQYANQEELYEAVHRMIAVPNVAGHPTGGAVDLQIIKNGIPLDFGTKVQDFIPDSYTFSPFVNGESQKNRRLLRKIMSEAGFAPFDGEWWHYSYGDKEWAKHYNQPSAIYEQIDFRVD